jgi:hypothetical protein
MECLSADGGTNSLNVSLCSGWRFWNDVLSRSYLKLLFLLRSLPDWGWSIISLGISLGRLMSALSALLFSQYTCVFLWGQLAFDESISILLHRLQSPFGLIASAHSFFLFSSCASTSSTCSPLFVLLLGVKSLSLEISDVLSEQHSCPQKYVG